MLSYEARVEHRSHRLLSKMAFFASHFYRVADAVVAVSEHVRSDLAALGVPEDTPLTTIPNPVDCDRVLRLSKEALDENLAAITMERPLFVAVGRLADQKDHRLLVEAFSIVRAEMGTGTLVIAGDGPLRGALHDQIRELGLESSVFLVGFLPNPFPLMAVADAFVLSSRVEGFGLALVEAMALGVPIVAGDCPGGVAEVLENGRAGLIVLPHDAHSLAIGMNAILSDVEIRRHVIRGGLRRSRDFAPGAIASQWLRLAHSVQG
jgi:glycosyltransferase involved in cell wall biosynthesis